jgi:hypothetical protein
VKRSADSYVAEGGSIRKSEDIVTLLQGRTSIYFVTEVQSAAIDAMRNVLNAVNLPEMKGISTSHHVFSKTSGKIFYRKLACRCSGAQGCLCYGPAVWEPSLTVS